MAIALAGVVSVMAPRKSAKTEDGVRMGNEIEAMRKEAGLTQQDLADRLEMTLQGYLNYRKGYGRVSPNSVTRWANALKVSPSQLADRLRIELPVRNDPSTLLTALSEAVSADKAAILGDVVQEIQDWPETEQRFIIELFRTQTFNWPHRPRRDPPDGQ